MLDFYARRAHLGGSPVRTVTWNLQISLPSCDLGRLHGAQLLRPRLRRLHLLYCPQLIRGIARHADIVVALEDHLQITDFQLGRVPQLCEAAGRDDDVVHEVVGDLEEGLVRLRVSSTYL